MQALQSIDRIIDGGRSLVRWRADARRTARSAIALTDQEVIFIVAAETRSLYGGDFDVRIASPSGFGLPLWAFSQYVLGSTGARQALNLDGARSSQLAARIGGKKFRVRAVGGTVNAVVLRPASGTSSP